MHVRDFGQFTIGEVATEVDEFSVPSACEVFTPSSRSMRKSGMKVPRRARTWREWGRESGRLVDGFNPSDPTAKADEDDIRATMSGGPGKNLRRATGPAAITGFKRELAAVHGGTIYLLMSLTLHGMERISVILLHGRAIPRATTFRKCAAIAPQSFPELLAIWLRSD